ncbi:type II secretion system protein [Kosmotoga pacifica]|uniref:type II secretion system protein n=1 Tax=Kosmotoga pacifica TaxID=1330330 RepID=UPI00069C6AE6|nr:prepilin-type N-terminal cleavage/methylation domain-containing protein [Kosmotoga pacifica]
MRKGFSLVELLIVLAVLAALIASITMVALNAVRKAKATQVAQNLKEITTSIENKIYLEGFDQLSEISSLSDLGRNIDDDYKLYLVTKPDGEILVNVIYNSLDTNVELVEEILPDATVTNSDVHYILQAGEIFYKITTSNKLKFAVSGTTITTIPKDSIYISKSVRIF